MTKSVLFVCLGNICRSPTAEGVFRTLSARAGLEIQADSAGTGGWHAGEPPHPPAVAAALRRGYDLSGLRARQVTLADFARFDLILAMDRRNLADLRALHRGPHPGLRLFLDSAEVPDPWYTGAFDHTLDLVEAGCRALIARIQNAQ